MSFRTRFLLTVILACTICTLGAVTVSSIEARRSGHRSLEEKAGAIISRLEAARSFVAKQGFLDKIYNDLVSKYPDGKLPKDEQDTLFNTVPIVSSMKIGGDQAEKDHYTFSVVSFDPRNKKNAPDSVEAEFLKKLESDTSLKQVTYFDETKNTFSLMRPIYLKQEDGCLKCHGDPQTSPWKNGKDILGYQMENWKEGQLHGMFKVTFDLAPLDQQIGETQSSMMRWGLGILIACLTGSFLFVSRPLSLFINTISDTVCALSEASHEVYTSSDQIAADSQSLAQGATEQAASLQQTASTLEEISSLAKQNADNSREAKMLSGEAQSVASAGVSEMEEMSVTVNSIKQSALETEEIIKAIDEIAFQTNILALNAAVEAARAGDAGKGFAVVAEEVRSLAQRSAQAAQNTTEKIKRSTDLADQGVAVSNRVKKSLDEVMQNSVKAAHIVDEIAAASKEQADGITLINTAVQELDTVTQTNAASAEESAATSGVLQSQARIVKDSVDKLQQLVGNKRGRTENR